jgi:hypothetical protein
VAKSFYTSGFLYHSPTHQILLQQYAPDDKQPLTLFQVKGSKGENPSDVFHRFIQETLDITLSADAVLPIYDYVHNRLGDQFVFYVDTKEMIQPANETNATTWVPLAKLSKAHLAEQTRHDIIIGERVIRAALEQKYIRA